MARVSEAAKEKGRQYSRAYYRKYSKFCYQLVRKWQARNPDKMKPHRVRNIWHTIIRVVTEKIQLLEAYGGKCACCGDDTYEFLSADHIYGDGCKERHLGVGTALYARLRRMGYPKDRYRLLCHNCNFSRGRYGYCPHQIQKNSDTEVCFGL